MDYRTKVKKDAREQPSVATYSVLSHQMHWIKGKVSGDDELVKCMHNLPSYLEKGENLREKVLNVGVLDWGQLQKWQNNHKQILYKSSRCSPSSINTSPPFSTDGSSANSSREPSCSPSHQRFPHPTPQSHLNIELCREGHYQDIQCFGNRVSSFQDNKPLKANTSVRQQIVLTEGPTSCQRPSEQEVLPTLEKLVEKSCSEEKIKNDELKMRAKKGQKLNLNFSDKVCFEGPEAVVLISPKGSPETYNPKVSQHPTLPNTSDQKLTEEIPRRTSDGSFSPHHHMEPNSEISNSSLFADEVENWREPNFPDALDINFSSDASQSAFRKISLRPKKTEEMPAMMATDSTVNEPSEGPSMKVTVRNVLPAGRNSGSRKDTTIFQFSSTHVSGKYESNAASASLYNSSSKQTATTITNAWYAVPLKKLLDPLVKPQAVNSHKVVEPPHEAVKSSGRASKSSSGLQSVKLKLDLAGCRTIEVDKPCENVKPKSSLLHALLKVAVSNGLPLFTFAVDDDSDILAATGRRFGTPRKDNYCWTYTFFTIQGIEKKSWGWINQGDKGRHQDDVPEVVAQMKVSDSLFPKSNSPDHVSDFRTREFILSSIDQGQAESSSAHPHGELAAIVINFPRECVSKDCLLGTNSAENREKGVAFGLGNLFNTTVILPKGVHSFPNKGQFPSLIQRWRSGGSCDCGGWDLGCQLQVLQNETQLFETAIPSSSCSLSDQYDLYCQEENRQPVFSLAPFKDEMFSVEFSVSLTLLQAFSICIAILDGRRLVAFSQQRCNLYEEMTVAVVDTTHGT